MLIRNIVALTLTIFSLGILYPGLTHPIIQITVSADLPILGKTTFYEQIQSILETVDTLYMSNNRFVAMLIFLFSVVVPVTKGIIVLSVLLIKDFQIRYKLHKFVYSIGKWSMADVFAVAVFIAFLSAQSNNFIKAELHEGFYYFSSYCLISLLGLQFIKIPEPAPVV